MPQGIPLLKTLLTALKRSNRCSSQCSNNSAAYCVVLTWVLSRRQVNPPCVEQWFGFLLCYQKKSYFKNYWEAGGDCFKSLQDLPLSTEGKRISWWVYFQIQHFLLSSNHKADYQRPLTTFETLLDSTTPRRHLVSTLYRLFFEGFSLNADSASKAWEKELGIQLEEEEWEIVNSLVHSGSVSISAQENWYKLRCRWYRTPSLLHNIYLSTSDRCWRCGKEEGTLTYIWMICHLVQPFWEKVHNHIRDISTFTLDFTPVQYVLHHTTLSRHTYRKSLAMHMVTSAVHPSPLASGQAANLARLVPSNRTYIYTIWAS